MPNEDFPHLELIISAMFAVIFAAKLDFPIHTNISYSMSDLPKLVERFTPRSYVGQGSELE